MATSHDPAGTGAPSKLPVYVLWALQLLAAAAFLASGIAKLLGAEPMVQLFDGIGIGQWFRYVTAVCEVTGAVALLIPRAAVYGAVLLICVMIGAVITHLFIVGGSPLPALVLFAMLAAVLWMRRQEVPQLR